MNCQTAREVFPELLDRRIPATAHTDVRAHVAQCPECQRELAALSQTAATLDALSLPEPSPALRQNFYTMLEQEKRSRARTPVAERRELSGQRPVWWRWIVLPLTGCALIALGLALGRRDDGTKQQLAALQNQVAQQNDQIAKMQKLVMVAVLEQQQNPANERLTSVLAKAKAANADDKVLQDLILAATLDPSANVRLRAIEALYPHADRELVRAGVLAALPREQNPLVQLELIDFVAGAQDQNATPVLEKIAADETTNNSVRDAAKFALARF